MLVSQQGLALYIWFSSAHWHIGSVWPDDHKWNSLIAKNRPLWEQIGTFWSLIPCERTSTQQLHKPSISHIISCYDSCLVHYWAASSLILTDNIKRVGEIQWKIFSTHITRPPGLAHMHVFCLLIYLSIKLGTTGSLVHYQTIFSKFFLNVHKIQEKMQLKKILRDRVVFKILPFQCTLCGWFVTDWLHFHMIPSATTFKVLQGGWNIWMMMIVIIIKTIKLEAKVT